MNRKGTCQTYVEQEDPGNNSSSPEGGDNAQDLTLEHREKHLRFLGWKHRLPGKLSFGKDEFLICILLGVLCLVISLPSGSQKGRSIQANTTTDKSKTPSEHTTDSPAFSDNSETPAENPAAGEAEAYERYIEHKLEQALSVMEGAGQVKAIVSLASGREVVVEKDRPVQQKKTVETDAAGGSRNTEEHETGEETIYRKEEDGSSVPYVVKMLQPAVKGVVIIAQGGNRREVVKNITEAVVALFDIEPHKIKVVKMKSIERKEE